MATRFQHKIHNHYKSIIYLTSIHDNNTLFTVIIQQIWLRLRGRNFLITICSKSDVHFSELRYGTRQYLGRMKEETSRRREFNLTLRQMTIPNQNQGLVREIQTWVLPPIFHNVSHKLPNYDFLHVKTDKLSHELFVQFDLRHFSFWLFVSIHSMRILSDLIRNHREEVKELWCLSLEEFDLLHKHDRSPIAWLIP